MILPIDVHVIFQAGKSSTLYDRCVDSIPENVNLHTVYDSRNQSTIVNRNLGFARGSSEWVSYVDYDDYVEPGAFDLLYEAALTAQCDAIFGNSIVHQKNSSQKMFTHEPNTEMLLRGQTAVHQLYLVKRTIVEKAIPFATKVTGHQATFDFNLTCAIGMMTRWKYLDAITYHWDIQDTSIHRELTKNDTVAQRTRAIDELKKLIYK
jgi:glycosyltransferase involved in cell wall biosynthesis